MKSGWSYIIIWYFQIAGKYDLQKEEELRFWIEEVTGMPIGENFQKGLKDGVILCEYVFCLYKKKCLDLPTHQQGLYAAVLGILHIGICAYGTILPISSLRLYYPPQHVKDVFPCSGYWTI